MARVEARWGGSLVDIDLLDYMFNFFPRNDFYGFFE